MNIKIEDILNYLFFFSLLAALLIQMRISRLYLYIVHDVPIESLLSLFININTAHRDIKQVGFEQVMISYIPFNGVIEPEYRTKEKEDKIKERGRLCILFFTLTFGNLIVGAFFDWLGITKSETYHETFSLLQSLCLDILS